MRCASIQMNSGEDMLRNAETAARLIREAAAEGAEFVLLPENTLLFSDCALTRNKQAWNPEAPHPAMDLLRETACSAGIAAAIGSMATQITGETDRFANRLVVIAPNGEIALHYDKINLFDADVPGDRSYRESERYTPGEESRLFTYRGFTFGCAICYDLRFPELFRSYAAHGAQILLLPAAFTAYTGALHWETLLRARAIENGCYVIASGQYGTHAGGRQTYGHSLIVNPWGGVIAELAEGEGTVCANLSADLCADVRARLPSCRTASFFKATATVTVHG